jgi:N-acetylneuraminate synthase
MIVNKSFRIKEFEVGCPMNPYIIAEIGVNHEGSMELAKRLIDEAVDGGAHAAKFQTYKAGKIASKFSPAYWDITKEPTDSQYKLFQKYDKFEPHHYQELAHHCQSKGIHFMSTPFDLEAVDFLEPLVPAFKIASADITNIPLLRKLGNTCKPVILSTGASTLAEVEMAVAELCQAGSQEIALLHCVLNYPTSIERAQLGMIRTLQRVFPGCVIGYSDHVVPDDTISAFECASLLGACILEKHFTHNKNLSGNDHYHAMDKDDLKRFMIKLDKYKTMLGENDTKNIKYEHAARVHARRSIVAAQNIKAGEILSEKNLIIKRPGHGISPIHWDLVLGKKATCDIEDDLPLDWSMIEN